MKPRAGRPRLPLLLPFLLLLPLSHGACAGADEEQDPLDPDLLADLAATQGSASGSDYAGEWLFTFTEEQCDCPQLTLDEETLDLCALAGEGTLSVTVSQVDGYLAATLPSQRTLTGPIDDDGEFTLAGNQDLATVAGSLQHLSRIDGQFEALDAGEGEVAQRLLGELAGEPVDCRWLGSLVLTR